MSKANVSASSRRKIALLVIATVILFGASVTAAYILLHPDTLTLSISVPESAGKDEAERISAAGGYFPTENGLFYPERVMTSAEAAEILSRVTGQGTGETGEDVLTESGFAAMLSAVFPAESVEAAMDCIRAQDGNEITRAKAAVCFNRLFSLVPAEEETAYYPDVAPDYWAWGDILTAAGPGEREKLCSDFFFIDGVLYCTDENGYCLKNAHRGSLFFDNTGRYTSGNAELDGYVSAAIAENTREGMTRAELLRAMYDYVREHFTYRITNYYEIGDLGWQMQEALTMYSTGKGNCYCYAAAFWAAARGLGYDAKIVSGTYGREISPHGWVEILQEGERMIYDVEIEMSYRHKGTETDMFAVGESKRVLHGYREAAMLDEAVSRRSSSGISPK